MLKTVVLFIFCVHLLFIIFRIIWWKVQKNSFF